MRKGIYLLPNTVTLFGMFFGFYAIMSSFKGQYVHGAWAILAAVIFDGLDGWVARMTNTASKFGIQLDSLSDLIAFGVAPSVHIYGWGLNEFGRVGWGACFFYVVCGALRLARYNVQKDTAESKAFTGLPIPGAATMIATLILFHSEMWGGVPPLKSYTLMVLPFLLAALMVSTFTYHGIKEVSTKQGTPFWFLVGVVTALAFIFMYPEIVMFILSAIYVAWGLLEGFYRLSKGKRSNISKSNKAVDREE
ncbi:MAG: CDP-diacylglycerol--serine O-phosphatidyltransferase [Nitrospirae bacterium]|nr:CDP-diacylglycerol--serine O-phosphatidyltransferase [Nitrospirota bacterium]